LTLR
jgi:hypothetical protein